MNKLRIGVLGCANIAKRSVIPAIKSIADFELIAIASRTKEKAELKQNSNIQYFFLTWKKSEKSVNVVPKIWLTVICGNDYI